MKIAVITCYDQNDYVRAQTLRRAFAACDGVQMVVIKNRHKGLLRYIEVPLKILRARLTQHLDAYVLTFRGYEMLLLLRLTFVRKPIVFDEMLNFVEYFEEHGRLRSGARADAWAKRLYRWLVRPSRVILADTPAHAAFSAALTGLPQAQFRVLPMAADETFFSPRAAKRPAAASFDIFYYGNGMTPLHGLQYVLEAAVLLKDEPNIRFQVVGGHARAKAACAAAVARGARIIYEPWIPFEQIAERARAAGLCLGGPFGKTLQSQFVVTGKTTQFLACGAPVVIGKNKASGVFQDKVNCLLVPPADAPAIEAAVRWAYAHPKELQRISAAGRRIYEQHFSQHIVDGIVQNIAKELQHA